MASRLAKVLMTYRTIPHSTTGVTPAELLLKQKPRTRLDLLRPDTASRVEEKQLRQKLSHDTSAKERSFTPNSSVYAHNYAQGQKWLPGHVVETTGPVSYQVELDSGEVVRRHLDQLRA